MKDIQELGGFYMRPGTVYAFTRSADGFTAVDELRPLNRSGGTALLAIIECCLTRRRKKVGTGLIEMEDLKRIYQDLALKPWPSSYSNCARSMRRSFCRSTASPGCT